MDNLTLISIDNGYDYEDNQTQPVAICKDAETSYHKRSVQGYFWLCAFIWSTESDALLHPRSIKLHEVSRAKFSKSSK